MEDTRLVITKMVLHNFKSFYGTKIISGFHPQFTCIIGPNGSGKSNLIDAMLFVFGYRASQIRQSKLIGLIHNSALHPNVKECYVTINFARVNAEHELIPGSEFSIKRNVTNTGDNNYYMNNSKVKRKELTDFLLREGVDFNNNRFLILQGEVRNISLMKPMATNQNQVGFLEYIEEIIGSNQFIQDIKDVEAELAQKNEERDQIAERLNISKRDVDALKDSFRDAQHYLDLQAELKLVDAKRLHSHREDLARNIEEMEGEVEEFQKKLDEKKQEIDNIEAEDKDIQKQIKNKEKDLESSNSKLEKSRKILDAQKNNRTKLKTEKEGAEKVLKDCKETKINSQNEISAAEQIIKTNTEEKEKIQKNFDAANEKLENAKIELEEKTNEVKAEIEKLQEDLQASKKVFAQENEEFLALESQMTQYQDEIDAIRRKVEESSRMREDKERMLEKTRDRINSLNELIPTKQQQINEGVARRDELKEIIEEKEEELHKLQENAKNVAVNLNELEHQAAKNPAKTQLLQCIAEFKERTNNQNIYLRLGDLAKPVEPKYNDPISVAAGNKLDYIVVQSVEDANLCIDELKQKGAGYGNFIILDEQERHRKAIEDDMGRRDPDQTELLLRKLKFKDGDKQKFLPAFYFVFRDTLLAPNMEVAKRVGYGKDRRRVVTMNGEIVERSGVMTGGGKQTARGGMMNVSKEELEQERANLRNLDDQIAYVRQEIDNAKREYHQINVDSIEVEIKKLQVDLEQNQEQLNYIREQLSRMTDYVQSEEDTQKINRLQQFLDDNRDELIKRRERVNSLRSDSQKIEKEISEIVDIRTKPQKEKIDAIEKEIDKHRKSKAKNEATIKAAERKITKYNKTIDEYSETERKTQEELSRIEEELASSKVKKTEQKAEVEQLSEEVSNIKKDIKELEEKDRSSKSKINELKLELEHMNTDFTKLKNDLKILKKELNSINAQFEKLGIQESDFGELMDKKIEDLDLQRAAIEAQLSEMNPDLSVIQEYEEKKRINEQHFQEFNEISEKRNEIAERCQKLKQQRFEMFMNGFSKIALKLKETYQILTLGGDAELELVDSVDPFSQGINFSVRPPGKSWKLISNLSGGEQTLSSLSLVFSLHQFKPTPFYVMDEIDAALDYRNVSIIANYLKERTTNAQFIVVSLRNHMFELADRLVGIFKVNDCASAITIDIDEERKVEDDQEKQNTEL